MKTELPEFEDKTKLIDYLVANKSKLISQKKSVTKEADAISGGIQLLIGKDDSVVKADGSGSFPISEDATQIKVRSIINL